MTIDKRHDDIPPAADRVRGSDLRAIGFEDGPLMGVALNALPRAVKHLGRQAALDELASAIRAPDTYVSDMHFGALALRVVEERDRPLPAVFVERDAPAPWVNYCPDAEDGALAQMRNAMRLPSAVRGAMMPDAHQGYGLPIGGVLETEGTIVPYAVGVDISCSMRLSVLALDPAVISRDRDLLTRALLRETKFGVGVSLDKPADRAVLDAENWSATALLRRLREKASNQLGTSGSGNHFVSFGVLSLAERSADLGLDAAEYLAVMSHSGSRGAGATIADHYSKIAEQQHPELPKDLRRLSWLDLDEEAGQEYLHSMNLMHRYAAACHDVIHERLAEHLDTEQISAVFNSHNLAVPSEYEGRATYVHRKGATPAGVGELGVIPGSMATPAFVVRGRGSNDSIQSASHGAGRRMSRTAARNTYTWKQIRPMLEEADVTLLAAGIDENPLAYKDIHEVMDRQRGLVDVIGEFNPKVVRMADPGERPED